MKGRSIIFGFANSFRILEFSSGFDGVKPAEESSRITSGLSWSGYLKKGRSIIFGFANSFQILEFYH